MSKYSAIAITPETFEPKLAIFGWKYNPPHEPGYYFQIKNFESEEILISEGEKDGITQDVIVELLEFWQIQISISEIQMCV